MDTLSIDAFKYTKHQQRDNGFSQETSFTISHRCIPRDNV